ncbi:MAG: hypothetical protein M3238_03215 [Actinomycetota bacterium]|nr:hypothetical protein [Actinomycetota bacterium]
MGFADRIRAFFSQRSNPALRELDLFAQGRKGLEGFIEPQTATSSTTLLLVDRQGEHLRAPVRDPQDAAAFCERRGIPVYDAAMMGYPQRMRDFERRRRVAATDSLEADFAELEKRLGEDDPDIPDR